MCFPKRGPFYFASLGSHTIVKASQVWALSSSTLDLTGDVLAPGMLLKSQVPVSSSSRNKDVRMPRP